MRDNLRRNFGAAVYHFQLDQIVFLPCFYPDIAHPIIIGQYLPGIMKQVYQDVLQFLFICLYGFVILQLDFGYNMFFFEKNRKKI